MKKIFLLLSMIALSATSSYSQGLHSLATLGDHIYNIEYPVMYSSTTENGEVIYVYKDKDMMVVDVSVVNYMVGEKNGIITLAAVAFDKRDSDRMLTLMTNAEGVPKVFFGVYSWIVDGVKVTLIPGTKDTAIGLLTFTKD